MIVPFMWFSGCLPAQGQETPKNQIEVHYRSLAVNTCQAFYNVSILKASSSKQSPFGWAILSVTLIFREIQSYTTHRKIDKTYTILHTQSSCNLYMWYIYSIYICNHIHIYIYIHTIYTRTVERKWQLSTQRRWRRCRNSSPCDDSRRLRTDKCKACKAQTYILYILYIYIYIILYIPYVCSNRFHHLPCSHGHSHKDRLTVCISIPYKFVLNCTTSRVQTGLSLECLRENGSCKEGLACLSFGCNDAGQRRSRKID